MLVGVTTGFSVAGGSVTGGVVCGGFVAGGLVSPGLAGGSVAGGFEVSGVLSVVGFDVSGVFGPVVSGVEAPVELSSVDEVPAVLSGTEAFSSSDVVALDVDDVLGVTVEVFGKELFDWLLHAARTHSIRQQQSTIISSFFKTKITSEILVHLL